MRRAILAAVKLDDNIYFDELIKECINLCEASNIQVVGFISQASKSIDPNYAFRKGKLEELKKLVEDTNADLVVFYNNLSVTTVSNLEAYLNEISVFDRTNLILDIFSSRAKSKEALIQTEVARLKYDLPKILKNYIDEDKAKGGGFRNKGDGETRNALIKRKMEKRISDLRKELKDLEIRKSQETHTRSKSHIKKVALVGYTNAGKSSLMNLLLRENDKSDKEVYEKDQLFATLDTSVRNIKYRNYEFLLFDTVGFVSDLPHELIEAFKSTLKAAKEADLLLHIMDAGNPNIELLKSITQSTLKEIEADDIPIIDVYNKIDTIDNKDSIGGLKISCRTHEGIENLLDTLINYLYPNEKEIKILIPYFKYDILSQYRKLISLIELESNDKGTIYKISGKKELVEELRNKIDL